MENQQFINLFFGVGLTVTGWFARELWAAVKDLKTDLAKQKNLILSSLGNFSVIVEAI